MQDGINKLFKKATTLIPRDKKNGWKIQKLHDMTHLWWFISQYGSPMNYDNGPTERHHKVIKIHGRRSSQHSDDEYRLGTGKRIQEKTALSKATAHMYAGSDDFSEDGEESPIVNEDAADCFPSGRPLFVVFFYWDHNGETMTMPEQNRAVIFDVSRNWNPSYSNNHSGPDKIHPTVMQKLKETMFSRKEHCALVYQECYKNSDGNEGGTEKVVFRAINSYRSEGPWYDWCWIDWQYNNGTQPTFSTKKKTHNKQILSDHKCIEKITGDSILQYKYHAYSVPARLLCIFKSFQSTNHLPLNFAGQSFLTRKDDNLNIPLLRQWSRVILQQEQISQKAGLLRDAQVIVHSAQSDFQLKHEIGHEYNMYTSPSTTHNGYLTPRFSVGDLDMIGAHTYCFEFQGCLKERYPPGKLPRIIQVHSWYDDLAAQFMSKFLGPLYY